jgi:hypothetical protein
MCSIDRKESFGGGDTGGSHALDFAIGNGEALLRRLCFLAETLLLLGRGRFRDRCCRAAGLLALIEVSFAY